MHLSSQTSMQGWSMVTCISLAYLCKVRKLRLLSGSTDWNDQGSPREAASQISRCATQARVAASCRDLGESPVGSNWFATEQGPVFSLPPPVACDTWISLDRCFCVPAYERLRALMRRPTFTEKYVSRNLKKLTMTRTIASQDIRRGYVQLLVLTQHSLITHT